jgi:hypothetical protein
MKSALDSSIAMRRQMNEMLTRSLHEMQGVAREDVDDVLRTIREAQAAVVDRLDAIDERIDELGTRLNGSTVEKSARPAAAASVGTPATEADALAALTLLLRTPIDVNAANANGQTALHNAAGRGSDPIVKLLLDKGAKLDAKDRLGWLPIDMARGAGGGGRGRGNAGGQVHESTTALLTEAMTSRGMAIPPPPARQAAPAPVAAQQ